jgi:hypothetical protein
VIVFALALVELSLALVDLFLVEIASPLLGIVRKLSAAMGRALALKPLGVTVTPFTPLFAVHPGAVGVVAGLPVVELALVAVATVLFRVELSLAAVKLPLLRVTVPNLAHHQLSSEHCGPPAW